MITPPHRPSTGNFTRTQKPKKPMFIKLAKERLPRSSFKPLSLQQGIKVLDDFGFSTEAYNPNLPRLSTHIPPAHIKNTTAVHVSDLWSHRQQKQFLLQTGLSDAQVMREKWQRQEVYLAIRNKLELPHVTDELYERILAEDDPEDAARLYAAGKEGKFLKQLDNQLIVNRRRRKSTTASSSKYATPKNELLHYSSETKFPSPRHLDSMQKLETLLSKCEDTLTRTRSSKQ